MLRITATCMNAACDYVTVFQETYDVEKYAELHLAGHKRVWPYRFDAQERALMGGMRGVAFSALLGLSDFRHDALATALHMYYLQRKYPHAEIASSCRLPASQSPPVRARASATASSRSLPPRFPPAFPPASATMRANTPARKAIPRVTSSLRSMTAAACRRCTRTCPTRGCSPY